MYYWLESGDRWTPDLDLDSIEWVDQTPGACVLPGEVTLREGPDPHELIFIVKADPENAAGIGPVAGNAVYYPTTTKDLADRQPDGTDGTISMPASVDGTFKPFQLIKLQSAATSSKEDPTTRFLGIILAAQLDLKQEEWRVTVMELTRWYLTKIYHTGIYYQPPTNDPAVFIENALPFYNESGKADQWVDNSGETEVDTPLFAPPDFHSYQGIPDPLSPPYYSGYWTLGSILNQLRYIYFTNAPTFSKPDLTKIMDWDECSETKWPFLLIYAGTALPNIVKGFALGAISLNECIDAIVKRAGRYTWNMKLNPSTLKHELRIYDITVGDGRSDSMTRTAHDRKAHESGELASGMISFDWSDCATDVKVMGAKERWETTLGHEIIETDRTIMEEALVADWTSTEQDEYQIKEKLGDSVEKYDNVFRRFRIAFDADWSTVTGNPAKLGPRQMLSELLTEDTNADADETHRKIKIRLWRWDGISGTYSEAPPSVSVQLDRNMTITIHGHDEDDEPIQNAAGKRLYPRYLCSISDPPYSVPWLVHPFRVTISVEDDSRLTGSATDVPANWPTMELVNEFPLAFQENRINAIHGTLHNGDVVTPVQNNYGFIDHVNKTESVTLHDDQDLVDVMAKRQLAYAARPGVKGMIELSYVDWDLDPGWQITTLENDADENAPPTVRVYGVIRETNIVGLAYAGVGQQHTTLELGVH